MDASTMLVIAIPLLLALALVMVLATARRRATTGRLSRETRNRDAGLPTALATEEEATTPASAEARARADDTRRALGSGARVPATTGGAALAERTPVDEEELGVSRRQFFNRGILAALAVFGGALGASLLAFLWPSSAGGFGSKVQVGKSLDDILAQVEDQKQPFYVPEARTYIVPYPSDALEAAKGVYTEPILATMEQGFAALYQKCVHLGCKVPWCPSSQWFECPCHGSKYNRVGEKRGGPAPRGLDRFTATVSGGTVTIDTAIVFEGPAIGTDTTEQGAEGPPCIGA